MIKSRFESSLFGIVGAIGMTLAASGCGPGTPVVDDKDAGTTTTDGAGPSTADAAPAATDMAFDAGPPKPWQFTEVGAASGVDWTHHPLYIGNTIVNMYDHGDGLAAGDFNGDGHEDLLLLSQCGPTGYFLGHGDGTFEDKSANLAMLDDGIRVAVSYGDFDNDGDMDFYVTFPRRPASLLQQNADGTFTDIAHAAGVDLDGHYFGSSFVDVNDDGYLDLVVVGTLQYTTDDMLPTNALCPAAHAGRPFTDLFSGTIPSDPTALFINGGPGKGYTFTNEAGTRGMPPGGTGDAARGFSDVITEDYDRDGDPDLVLVELFTGTTAVLENDGSGHFTDKTAALIPQASFGAPAGAFDDFDNDGWPDLFLIDMHSDMWVAPGTSFSTIETGVRYKGFGGPNAGFAVGDNPTGPLYGNSLWMSQGGQSFVEKDMAWKAETFMPWGIVAADFDNDGDVDVFLPSGMSNPYDYWPNGFLENAGDHFEQRQSELGFDPPPQGIFDNNNRINGQPFVASARTAAAADFDEDGDLDLVVKTWDQKVNLFRNDLPPGNHHIDIGLTGKVLRDPFGTFVEVTAGGKTYSRSMAGARGYLSQSTRWIHVGLGANTSIDSVVVKWTDGAVQTVMHPDIDKRLTITHN